jgi:hypothetical protein
VDGMIAWATSIEATRNRAKPGWGGTDAFVDALASTCGCDGCCTSSRSVRRRCRRSVRRISVICGGPGSGCGQICGRICGSPAAAATAEGASVRERQLQLLRLPAGPAQRRAAGAGPARLRKGVKGVWEVLLRWRRWPHGRRAARQPSWMPGVRVACRVSGGAARLQRVY